VTVAGQPSDDIDERAEDRAFVQTLLNHTPGAWNDFVDRYVSLLYHVVRYTAYLRGTPLRPEDVEDVVSEILVQVVANDFALLRQYEARSTLKTYLTVVARRICGHDLVRREKTRTRPLAEAKGREPEAPAADDARMDMMEEVHQLMDRLPKNVREVFRLYHVERRTYEEISTRLHIPVNSIGPILSRARQQLRQRFQDRRER
jgi:RNA polymerase sigma-70 factor (ECF subfamily)